MLSYLPTGWVTDVLGENLRALNLRGTAHTNVETCTDTWTFTDVTGTIRTPAEPSPMSLTAHAHACVEAPGPGSVGGACGVEKS